MSNIYLWRIPENHPNKYIGIYDDNSPDCLLFRRGNKVDPSQFTNPPIIEFEVQKKQLEKYDCLVNSSMIPLINPRLAKLLTTHAKADIQLIDSTVKCTDGELKGYKILNVIRSVNGIDHQHSIVETLGDTDEEKFIIGLKRLVCKPNIIGNHSLVRDAEVRGNLYTSQVIYDLFKKEKVKGVWLATPKEYYTLLFPNYN